MRGFGDTRAQPLRQRRGMGERRSGYSSIAAKMLRDPVLLLRRRPCTGRIFNYGWLERHLRLSSRRRARDVYRPRWRELTAVSIAQQVLLNGGCERLMVCGGSRNPLR